MKKYDGETLVSDLEDLKERIKDLTSDVIDDIIMVCEVELRERDIEENT